MRGRSFVVLFFSLYLLLLLDSSFSIPLCTDSRAPLTVNSTLSFCPYNGMTCCNSVEDLQLQKQFQAMNISDSSCSSILKSILCARCDPFSADLFTVAATPRPVPVLCNSSHATNDFCSKVWNTCENVSFLNSPFAPTLQGQAGIPMNSTINKLTDFWQSKFDFCNAFGGSSTDGSLCYDGEPVKLNETETVVPTQGLCLEKIGNGSYLNMVAHPDGSNRAFFSSQPGKIWLAVIPEEGSGGTLEFDESSPFVDLTDEVHYDTEFGLMGMAFHPNFVQNGRFFASFNCDKAKWPACSGRCSCNSDVDCDPSKLSSDSGAQPCQYQSVIAEYSTNGSAAQPSLAKSVSPLEARRIFTMGLPFTSHHGGQILFGPSDGYLYLMMGDGGGDGDPYNFAQNKKSLLGKITRLDIDNIPSAEEVDQLGLWGNYSIPMDNPFVGNNDSQPEIWAVGLRNPWRCSFDSERPSYFMCGDVGQDVYEEVNYITKGGNYGWRVFEGPYLFTPLKSPGGNTSPNNISPIPPVMGYTHSEINKNEGSASITAGYFYRSTTDPCMYARYLYADLYGSAIWTGTETPENSGNFTSSKIDFRCAQDSPIKCTFVTGSERPSLEYVYSFGEDNQKDIYVLASSGLYRIVAPTRCNYSCSKENVTAAATPSPTVSPSSQASQISRLYNKLIFPLSLSLLALFGIV